MLFFAESTIERGVTCLFATPSMNEIIIIYYEDVAVRCLPGWANKTPWKVVPLISKLTTSEESPLRPSPTKKKNQLISWKSQKAFFYNELIVMYFNICRVMKKYVWMIETALAAIVVWLSVLNNSNNSQLVHYTKLFVMFSKVFSFLPFFSGRRRYLRVPCQ